METIRLGLVSAHQAHKCLMDLWVAIKPWLLAGHRLHIEVRAEKRSDAQNRLLWARLGELSRQVIWHGQRLSKEEWKDVFTAAMKRQKVVPGIDGGFVVLGSSTRRMTVAEMGELMELMEAFGTQQGVQFTAPEPEVTP